MAKAIQAPLLTASAFPILWSSWSSPAFIYVLTQAMVVATGSFRRAFSLPLELPANLSFGTGDGFVPPVPRTGKYRVDGNTLQKLVWRQSNRAFRFGFCVPYGSTWVWCPQQVAFLWF